MRRDRDSRASPGDTNMAAWQKSVSLIASSDAHAKATTRTGDIDCTALPAVGNIFVTVTVTFGGSPDGNATVYVYGSHDGATFSTIALWSQDIAYGTSATKRLAFQIPANLAPYVRVSVYNADTTDAITSLATYSYRKG